MGRDELRRALDEASDGPERDFTGTWAQGRRVRRRRQTAQGLGVVAVAAAAVGAFALGGGNLLGEDATIEPLPPATQTPTTEQIPDEATTESDPTESDPTEAATDEPPEATGTEVPGPTDPLPTTVEDYVRVYLAAGMSGDDVLLERMGTDEATAASVTWTDLSLLLDEPRVSDGVDAGQDNVSVLAEGPYAVTLTVDRAAVEAGNDDGVLRGEQNDAPAQMTPEEYADLAVETWLVGAAGIYAAEDAVSVLDQVPTDGSWEHTGSSEEGDAVLVTFENDTVEGDLVLTVDPELVEAREYQAVVDASFSEESATPGQPPAGDLVILPDPCQTPTPGLEVVTGAAGPDVTDRAQELLDLASRCDLDGLIALAEEQSTTLTFDEMPAAEAFSGEEGGQRVHALATLLVNYPPVVGGGNDGPTDSAQWPQLTQDQWPELIELGIATEQDVAHWQEAGSYTGWRLWIEGDGNWSGLLEGD